MMPLPGKIRQIDEVRWEIPPDYKPGMRVPARIYADREMLQEMGKDLTLEQGANVASLDGIYKYSIVLPDGHQGYGFPIGGVAATDAETGVISPGGVGYDINCLPAGTRVLTPLGFWLPIERVSVGQEVVVLNQNRAKPTPVILTLRRNDKSVMKIKTASGFELALSPDHPILTREGMREAGGLTVGTEVGLHPFEGVPYEEATDFEIVRETAFRSAIREELKKRGLLPLTARNPKLPLLLKLLGYLLGDGTICGKSVIFYGKLEDLQDIQADLKRLGYKSSIYTRRRRHRLKGREFVRTEASLKVSARSLAELLLALGYPRGKKTQVRLEVPHWISRLPLWLKRLFLAAYFGAEMSAPKTMNGYNFYMPEVKVSRKQGKEVDGRRFLNELKRILNEFGVSSTVGVAERDNGRIVYRLSVHERPENLIALWSKIGYEYNRERKARALAAVVFLKFKEAVKRERELLRCEIQEGHGRSAELLRRYRGVVNRRLIERSLYEGTGDARVPQNFPTFERFMKEHVDGEVVFDKVVQIESIPHDGWVYDFTVADSHHNFVAEGFVTSNCGVRLVKTNLDKKDVEPKLRELVDTLFRNVPSGLGSRGKVRLSMPQLDEVLEHGARWAVENGYGWQEDLERLEEGGCMEGASASKVSTGAKNRGLPQLGSLGSGNHFLEVQVVDKIYEPRVAKAFGITHEGQVTVMIHTGSRGLGHQVCSDYLRRMEHAVRRYGIRLLDRELVNVPFRSPEGQDYFSAMKCAANYAWANRQMIVHWVRQSFEQVFRRDAESLGLHIVYDVAHNIAKLERHRIDGEVKEVVVHRKGATRAFGPGHPDIPALYREVGQPVLIPGDMGTASYILVGTQRAMEETFGSTAHGAGRHLSRHAALRQYRGDEVRRRLASKGIYIRAAQVSVIAEEAPEAYKDVDKVAEISDRAGIAKRVARMVPIGVAKG